MPNRIIKESIKRSPEIDRLSWFEEVVFYRLIVTADDYGRLDGRIVVLKNDLFPTKESVTRKAIEDALNKLTSVGLLVPYVDAESGMPFYYFPKWDKHQRVRDSKERYPAPQPCGNSRQLAANCGEYPQNAANCGLESESESESKSESKESVTQPRTASAPARHKYGQYENVLLSEADMVKLRTEFPTDWQERIERLSEYIASKGVKYKNHLATIRNWAKKDKERTAKPTQTGKTIEARNYEQRDYKARDLSHIGMSLDELTGGK